MIIKDMHFRPEIFNLTRPLQEVIYHIFRLIMLLFSRRDSEHSQHLLHSLLLSHGYRRPSGSSENSMESIRYLPGREVPDFFHHSCLTNLVVLFRQHAQSAGKCRESYENLNSPLLITHINEMTLVLFSQILHKILSLNLELPSFPFNTLYLSLLYTRISFVFLS